MSYNAQLNDDNIVIGISETLSPITADGYVEIERADSGLLGRRWNGSDFEDVPEPQQPAPVKSWNELDMKRAFTREERLAIRVARAEDPLVDDVMDLLEATTRSMARVQADDADFLSGLDYFVSIGLLTAERKAEILEP